MEPFISGGVELYANIGKISHLKIGGGVKYIPPTGIFDCAPNLEFGLQVASRYSRTGNNSSDGHYSPCFAAADDRLFDLVFDPNPFVTLRGTPDRYGDFFSTLKFGEGFSVIKRNPEMIEPIGLGGWDANFMPI